MKAQEQYKIIKRLAEQHVSKDYASIKIGCSRRHINRLLIKYNTQGTTGFIHGNTGRKLIHFLSELQKKRSFLFITINIGILTVKGYQPNLIPQYKFYFMELEKSTRAK